MTPGVRFSGLGGVGGFGFLCCFGLQARPRDAPSKSFSVSLNVVRPEISLRLMGSLRTYWYRWVPPPLEGTGPEPLGGDFHDCRAVGQLDSHPRKKRADEPPGPGSVDFDFYLHLVKSSGGS